MIDWNKISSFELKGGYRKGHIEKDFQAEIFRNMRKLGYYAYHIQDIGLGTRFLDGIIMSPQLEMGAIEFKKIDGYTFNMSQFEPSQMELLMNAYNSLKRYPNIRDPVRILIYSKKTNTYSVKTFTELWEGKNGKGGIKLF